MKKIFTILVLGLGSQFLALGALTSFQTYTGTIGVSTDGVATLSSSGTVSASVPIGSTVVAAYLYGASFDGSGGSIAGTLAGVTIPYGAFVSQVPSCCGLGMRRADVTSIVKPLIDGGAGGVYDFDYTENFSSGQDGSALIVVYSNGSLTESTVAILDGFSNSSGDSFTANFAEPLDPTAPDFFMEMRLGISFSCGDSPCGGNQSSQVDVNGTTITRNAGNYDDSDQPPPGNAANGRLFTMGGFNDPFSPLLPSYDADHERYNLQPYITKGSKSVKVDTLNPSGDDNIFVAVFSTSGKADVIVGPGVPEPSTYVLMLTAGALLAGFRKFKR